ncbi:unnamed protein product [Vitrella brassicaformis CCMP3155]|uniref:AMP-dependent synthetase/ligase domain-containing protein n=1 Tax=Vitrella brassicaformis (strain CCMP3155) TaxID=1169540 RepID=A0A0G4GRG6_VITBC|nr:unnamed protein product [Vitrella brassicaformis CCMP3155]|eukprot:CEM33148.1 unnamed protein product [Vitrella brassicaformis CCMP3155]
MATSWRSVLHHWAAAAPQEDALVWLDGGSPADDEGSRLSFADLLSATRQLASCLEQQGVTAKQRVLHCFPSLGSPEVAISLSACLYLDAIPVILPSAAADADGGRTASGLTDVVDRWVSALTHGQAPRLLLTAWNDETDEEIHNGDLACSVTLERTGMRMPLCIRCLSVVPSRPGSQGSGHDGDAGGVLVGKESAATPSSGPPPSSVVSTSSFLSASSGDWGPVRPLQSEILDGLAVCQICNDGGDGSGAGAVECKWATRRELWTNVQGLVGPLHEAMGSASSTCSG